MYIDPLYVYTYPFFSRKVLYHGTQLLFVQWCSFLSTRKKKREGFIMIKKINIVFTVPLTASLIGLNLNGVFFSLLTSVLYLFCKCEKYLKKGK